jgi:aspartate racemase
LFGFDETGIVDEELVKKQLIKGVGKLELAGCNLVIVACNFHEMQLAVKVPILNIIKETKKRVIEFGHKKVGLFASESTSKLKLYQKRFIDSNIEVIAPNKDQQKILNRVIENVMGGNQKTKDIIVLKDVARDYIEQGAEAIVVSCTEIPLAINQTHTDIKLFDTIEIIVQCAVDYSLNY